MPNPPNTQEFLKKIEEIVHIGDEARKTIADRGLKAFSSLSDVYVFRVKITKGGKITIPKAVMESERLLEGDLLEVMIKKI